MIDTPNAGQTCRQCRHYEASHPHRDPFFGNVPVKDYCTRQNRRIDISDGESCRLFLKRIYG